MRNFKELKIWQKGFSIAVNSFKLVTAFPREEKFGIAVQITNAAISIPQILLREAAGAVKKIIIDS
jgi:four helix bundle protein